jgi:magnesium transporter
MTSKPTEQALSQSELITRALIEGRNKRARKLLHRMRPAKVAGLLKALPPAERSLARSMVATERAGRVLSYLHEEITTGSVPSPTSFATPSN